MNEIFLSIIIPTLGRKKELDILFESIKNERINCSYEVLVIDQNEDNLIDDICEKYREKIELIQCKVEFKGLSRAKNYGIKKAKGTVVCFPDDDAELVGNTINTALKLLKQENVDCVFGKCIDKETGQDSVIKFKDNELKLTLNNFEGAFVEATMFAKRNVFDEEQYDEEMGVGSIYGSQEGYDLVYRLLMKKKKMFYSPNIIFYHPQKIKTRTSKNEIKRAFFYSCGFGHLCKKHGFHKKYKKRIRKLVFGLPIIFIVRCKEIDYFKAQIMGLVLGYKYI